MSPICPTIAYMAQSESLGDRRNATRAVLSGAFANKYIDGIPHTVNLLDVSETGFQVRRILEPTSTADAFSVEVSAFGVRFFAWAKRVWTRGDREAFHFIGVDPIDQARFKKALRCA